MRSSRSHLKANDIIRSSEQYKVTSHVLQSPKLSQITVDRKIALLKKRARKENFRVLLEVLIFIVVIYHVSQIYCSMNYLMNHAKTYKELKIALIHIFRGRRYTIGGLGYVVLRDI